MGNRGIALRWVPLAFALSAPLLLPAQPAHACSIADPNAPAPPPGWYLLQPAMLLDPGHTSVPVGTDGFFTIQGDGFELSAEAATASLRVEVRDAAGNLVPGRARLLKDYPFAGFLFGWQAEQSLEIGATLTATLSGTPVSGASKVGGDFALVVTGPPADLPTPELTFSWSSYFQGQGKRVTCAANPNFSSCGGPDHYEVPDSFLELAASYVSWELPPVSVGVAWEAELEAVGDDADARLPDPNFGDVYIAYSGVDAPPQSMALGMVVFPTAADRHCVRVVARDLRSGIESRSEVCEAPAVPISFESDAPELAACLTPPTEGATRAWCRIRQDPRSPVCSKLPPDAPIVGDDASGDGTSGDGTSGDEKRRSRTSQGCQMSVGTQSSGGAAAFLAALLLLRRRRDR